MAPAEVNEPSKEAACAGVPSGFILKLYQMVNGAPDDIISVSTHDFFVPSSSHSLQRTIQTIQMGNAVEFDVASTFLNLVLPKHVTIVNERQYQEPRNLFFLCV